MPSGPKAYASDAVALFAALVRQRRLGRSLTVEELAEQSGLDVSILEKLELGDPGVPLGIAFEAAATLGVRLFDADENLLEMHLTQVKKALSVLPRIVEPRELYDDF